LTTLAETGVLVGVKDGVAEGLTDGETDGPKDGTTVEMTTGANEGTDDGDDCGTGIEFVEYNIVDQRPPQFSPVAVQGVVHVHCAFAPVHEAPHALY
jgi:hypothetical protein